MKQNGAYCLSRIRKTEVEARVSSDKATLTVNQNLRQLIDQITDPGEREFLDEAIKTFEVAAYRASIIMVWLLSLDHLFAYIIAKKLTEFNTELAKVTDRRVKVSAVATRDDFSEIPEGKFIEICRAAKIITNDVRKILDVKLGIRNSYAHPSTVKLPKSKALEFVEDLVTNVILKY